VKGLKTIVEEFLLVGTSAAIVLSSTSAAEVLQRCAEDIGL